MDKPDNQKIQEILKPKNNWLLFFIALAVIWTAIMGVSLARDINQQNDSAYEYAKIRAIEALNKDIIYRRWVTGQGGVYVPISDHTPPNPYLSHLPNRDITTTTGEKLTLVNPAYMTRQVNELTAQRYGVQGHITSLNPLRPENKPDEWETSALKQFQNGVKEVNEMSMINNEPYIRLMIPMVTEQGCLKCHASQGYKVGQQRGGLSTSSPLTPHLAVAKASIKSLTKSHIIIWICGLAGISLFGHLTIIKQRQAEDMVRRYNSDLEIQVRERTETLEQEIIERKKTEKDLKDTTYQLIQSEKMSTIGMLAASMAHEINSPLGAICSSSDIIKTQFDSLVNNMMDEIESYSSNRELIADFLKKLPVNKPHIPYKQSKAIKEQMIELLSKSRITKPEEIADFLVNIGITENIDKFIPLFESDYKKQIMGLILKIANIKESNYIIETAIKQSSRVIQVLRDYARSNESQKAVPTHTKDTLETSLILYGNKIKHGIELITELNDVDSIICYPHELCQVWTNIIHNAIQAMDNSGTLKISLKQNQDNIEINISDTGPGIPLEIQDKIFDPLFTTKKQGEGTGLGLDIAKKIIEKHNGTIKVSSKPGEGAAFIISLPVANSIDSTTE